MIEELKIEDERQVEEQTEYEKSPEKILIAEQEALERDKDNLKKIKSTFYKKVNRLLNIGFKAAIIIHLLTGTLGKAKAELLVNESSKGDEIELVVDSNKEELFGEEEIRQEIWEDIEESVEKLTNEFGLKAEEFAIIVSPEKQKLYLIKNNEVIESYSISTAKAGVGSEAGSNKTPPGTHRIKNKFGDDAKLGTIFEARRNTGKISDIITNRVDVPEDFVTTRVMWLDGQEEGINSGGDVDSHQRYIYIHGTPEEGLIGEPASHGCVRMINSDIIELFDKVPIGTLIEIQNNEFMDNEEIASNIN